MEEIILASKKFNYTFRKNKRAKNIRLGITENLEITLTVPFYVSRHAGEFFLRQKTAWLLEKIAKLKMKKPSALPRRSREDYLRCKKLAKEIAEKKLKHFNASYNFSMGKISIRNQKTRWGSCSKAGNLSFSYRIIYLSEELCDYIIVHELCHLGEFNHSGKFWALVARAVPDYKKRRIRIRKI